MTENQKTTKTLGTGLFGNHDIQAKPLNVKTIEVQVSLSPLFDEVVASYRREIDRTGRSLIRKDQDHLLSSEQIAQYAETLLWMRVNYVNGTLQRDYRDLYSRVTVPTVLHFLICSIGLLDNDEFGLSVKPILKPKEKKENEKDEPFTPLSLTDLKELSSLLFSLEKHGLKLVRGLVSRITGVDDVMLACYLEDSLVSFYAGNPADAAVAAFFDFQGLQDFFGVNAFRITYGEENYFRGLIDALIGPDLS
jgi:hypothetical protein